MKTMSTLNKNDILLLKWPITWLVVVLFAGAIWYGGAYWFKEEKNQAAQAAKAKRIEMIASIRQLEEEARTVIDYKDRFHRLQEEKMVGEEDRLQLVETVGRIRDRHFLYPMQLDIEPRAELPLRQSGGLENPGEGISLRVSRIVLEIPLLHEEDLFRLLEGLSAMQHGIIVTEECVIKRNSGDTDSGEGSQGLVFRQNLLASCKLLWLTFSARPAGGVPEAGSIPPGPGSIPPNPAGG